MRSERKKRRTFLARFMVLMMIINLLSGVSPSVARADGGQTWGFQKNGIEVTQGNIELTETADEASYNNGEFDVKLEVKGGVTTQINDKKLDVVLVVDRSGSMAKDGRMAKAKAAAVDFVNKLLADSNGKVRIGLVSFAGKEKDQQGNEVPVLTSDNLQNNKAALTQIINGYYAYQGSNAGTFTQAALREANKLFDNADNKRIIVLVSDGVPTHGYDGNNIIGNGNDTNQNPDLDKIKTNTIAEANEIKNTGVEIFSVGIGVYSNGADILTAIASPDHYTGVDGAANGLGKVLADIADTIKKDISNGDLKLVMNDYVDYKEGLEVKITKEGVIQGTPAYAELEARSTAIKNNANWNAGSKTLILSGITLDKDELLTVTYKAQLIEKRMDNNFYPINLTAVLFPDGEAASPNNCLSFIIPEVKDLRTITITVNKKWLGSVPDIEKVEFNVLENGQPSNYNIEVTPDPVVADGTWTGKLEGLPKYRDGEAIKYTVEEKKVEGYENTIESSTDNDGNLTFTVKNIEKINLKVTKIWKDTPVSLKTKVTVDLYANGVKTDKSQEIAVGETETTFNDLLKTDEAGKDIKYTFRENGEDGNKITLNGEEFEVAYDDENHTITNTYKNLQTKTIKVTLSKKWVGDTGNGATFNIKNMDNPDDKGIDVHVKAPEWKAEVELRKYNDDGTPAKYKVSEYSIIGFNSTTDCAEITEDKQEITFTNTQIKHKLTVRKEWVGTPTNAAFVLTYRYNGEDKSEEFSIPSDASEVTKELPVHDLDGTVIDYTVTEKKIDGYKADKETQTFNFVLPRVTADRTITFKNTELIDITVIKEWDYNVPESEQQSVDVELSGSGGAVVEIVTLNADNKWQHTFENLPYIEDGYTVKEININGRPVDELKKLFKVKIGQEETNVIAGLKETTEIIITNSMNIPGPDPDDPDWDKKINVTKYWETGATPAAINAVAYLYDYDNESGLPAGEAVWSDQEGAVWEGVITLTKPKADKGKVFDEIDLSKAIPTMMDPTAGYFVLETSIAGEDGGELTPDEVQSLLQKLVKEGKVEYKIGNYGVLVQRAGGSEKVLIKNMSKNKISRIKVTKDWTNTPDSHKKPVAVQLYKEDGTDLVSVGAIITLTEATGWTGWFNGIPKLEDNGDPIKYHVAEIRIGELEKDTVSLDEIANGYEIGQYKVEIENDGTENVIVKNDIQRVDVWAVKEWAEGNTKVPVEFTLYSKKGETFTKATDSAIIAVDGALETVFKGVPKFDEDGNEINYYVFETKIGSTVAVHNYSDNYTVSVSGGTYTVKITLNGHGGKDRIYIRNSYAAIPPIIPDDPGDEPPGGTPGDTPGNTPGDTPGNTPGNTPGDPTVDVPNDETPQGDAPEDTDTGIVDDIDEDDIPDDDLDVEDDTTPQGPVDVDEDETPQGKTGLPKTGGTAGDFYSIIGIGLIGLGFVFKKRKN